MSTCARVLLSADDAAAFRDVKVLISERLPTNQIILDRLHIEIHVRHAHLIFFSYGDHLQLKGCETVVADSKDVVAGVGSFDRDAFRSSMHSSELGKVLLCASRLTSTQTFLQDNRQYLPRGTPQLRCRVC